MTLTRVKHCAEHARYSAAGNEPGRGPNILLVGHASPEAARRRRCGGAMSGVVRPRLGLQGVQARVRRQRIGPVLANAAHRDLLESGRTGTVIGLRGQHAVERPLGRSGDSTALTARRALGNQRAPQISGCASCQAVGLKPAAIRDRRKVLRHGVGAFPVWARSRDKEHQWQPRRLDK